MSDNKDYAFYVTMDEMLLMLMEHLDEARHAGSDYLLGFHLRMASRVMRCALELYGDWLEQRKPE